MRTITLKAKAKINITLDVVGKRANGYHDLRMIMQTINLHDTVYLKKTKSKGVRLGCSLSWLPKDDKNIAYKVAAMFLDKIQADEGVFIYIEKRIPIAAGLAGGSTDAAAVLVGLNKLFNAGYTKKQLMEMSVPFGADIPFCIARGTMLAEGIGEVLTPLRPFPSMYVLLAKPNLSVSTAAVYGALRVDEITRHPQTEEMIAAIAKKDVPFICEHLRNVLEDVTIPMHPQISRIKKDMLDLGAMASMMSGSGPTVFGFFRSKDEAIKAATYFKHERNLREVHVTTIYQQKEGKRYGRRKEKFKNKRIFTP
jgi:4-diphosphocytidyl-2-C-methyl-D-erythritol kinase